MMPFFIKDLNIEPILQEITDYIKDAQELANKDSGSFGVNPALILTDPHFSDYEDYEKSIMENILFFLSSDLYDNQRKSLVLQENYNRVKDVQDFINSAEFPLVSNQEFKEEMDNTLQLFKSVLSFLENRLDTYIIYLRSSAPEGFEKIDIQSEIDILSHIYVLYKELGIVDSVIKRYPDIKEQKAIFKIILKLPDRQIENFYRYLKNDLEELTNNHNAYNSQSVPNVKKLLTSVGITIKEGDLKLWV